MPDVRRACAAPVLGTGSTSVPSNIRATGRSFPRALSIASRSPHQRPSEPAHIWPWPFAVLTAWPDGTSASPAWRTARLSRLPVHLAPSPFRSFGSPIFGAQNRRSVSSQGSTKAVKCPASQCLRPRVPSRLINVTAQPPWPCPAFFGCRGLPQPAPNPLGRA